MESQRVQDRLCESHLCRTSPATARHGELQEDKKKRQANLIKGRIGNILTDIAVPSIPEADFLFREGFNKLLDIGQSDIPDEEKFQLYNKWEVDYGSLMIPSAKMSELNQIREMALSGTLTTTSPYGKKTTKILDYETQKNVKNFFPIALLYNAGGAPSETGNLVKYIIKIAKKKAKTQKQIEKAKESQEDTGRGRGRGSSGGRGRSGGSGRGRRSTGRD